jgi:hypothetical protein
LQLPLQVATDPYLISNGKEGKRIIANSLNIVGVGSSMRQEPYGTMLSYCYQEGDDILRMKGIGVDYIMFDYVFAPIASNVADIIETSEQLSKFAR